MGWFDKVKKAFNFDDDDEAFEDFEEEETKRAEEAKKEQFRNNSVSRNNYDVQGSQSQSYGGYKPKSNNNASAYIDRTTNEDRKSVV